MRFDRDRALELYFDEKGVVLDMVKEGKYLVSVPLDLKELIPRFIENRWLDLHKLKENWANRDYKSLSEIGHSLKGVGGGYGFHQVTDMGREIEIAAKSQEDSVLERLISSFEQFLENMEVSYVDDDEF